MPAQYPLHPYMVLLSNLTQFSPMLYLTGFPGLETIEHWIFIFFFLMYLVAISGNCFILIIIKTSPRLHTAMYYLLSFLTWACRCPPCPLLWESFGSNPMASTLEPAKSRCSVSTHFPSWSPQCSLSCPLIGLWPSVIP